ncbi:MAG: ester cyclase [Vicinamibacterales bacterium]
MTDNARTLRAFMTRVWNEGDLAAADQWLAPAYTIHSDPGDPWEGRTLDRDGFRARLAASRAPFPDLAFEIHDTIADGDRVAISWTLRGTNTGPLGGQPPTGRRVETRGLTVYHFEDGRIAGHTQVVDRVAIAQQLGLAARPTA